jgi:uncharacterized protein
VIAFCIAVVTTPAGVSGAVFLVPVQISVLRTPSPPDRNRPPPDRGPGAGGGHGRRHLLRRGLGALALVLGLRYALLALI